MGVSDASHGAGPTPPPNDGKASRNELIFQCIMSNQVPEDELGALMEDPEFRAYFDRRIGLLRNAEAAVPPHAAGLLSNLSVWLRGWRKGGDPSNTP